MNKKLFLAGVALLAAVGFTSCNSDTPIDPSSPSGIAPTVVGHEVGVDYDWTASVKDYSQLQEYWKADKDAVAKLLADNKANTANICIGLANYDLSDGAEIVLPDFWGTGLTNGKVVNITIKGIFKNADFEREHTIKGDVPAFPVKINTNNLKGAEVNFTFGVEKFDLYLQTREARSTFSGEYTIGYMFANADVTKNDAVELKSGVVEALDLRSEGKFKGTFDGVWTKTSGDWIDVTSNGVYLTSPSSSGNVVPGVKNVYVEEDAGIDTWYQEWGNDKQYQFSTVKFVQKSNKTVNLYLWATDKWGNVVGDNIESILGFNKSKCYVHTYGWTAALDNIDAMEKVTVTGSIELKKDIFTDVEFSSYVNYNTKNISAFDNVTFNSLRLNIHDNNQTLTYDNVNFKDKVYLYSKISDSAVTNFYSTTYQWVIDITTNTGHFEKVTNDNPILDANKGKEEKVYPDDEIQFDGAGSFYKATYGTDAQLNEALSSYIVTITHTDYDGYTYIPEGTNVLLNSCKFKEVSNNNLNTTLTSLNNIWGNRTYLDEQCWYTVYVDGAKYIWKKAQSSSDSSSEYPISYPRTLYILYPAATE